MYSAHEAGAEAVGDAVGDVGEAVGVAVGDVGDRVDVGAIEVGDEVAAKTVRPSTSSEHRY